MAAFNAMAAPKARNYTFDFEWLKQENEKTVAKAYNLAQLSAMCDLQRGWDGESGKVISNDIIAYVGDILLRVSNQPEVYPTAEGGIQIQYEKNDKTYMEIVFSDDSIIGMKVLKGDYQTAQFTDFTYNDVKPICEYIGEFENA